jgi:hypothetical protein
MTSEEKRKLIEAFTALLERSEDVRVSWYRRAIEVEPVDGWKRYEPDPTSYALIIIGPPTAFELELEQRLRQHTERTD